VEPMNLVTVAQVSGSASEVRAGKADEVTGIAIVVAATHVDIDRRAAPETRNPADLPSAEEIAHCSGRVEVRQRINIVHIEDIGAIPTCNRPIELRIEGISKSAPLATPPGTPGSAPGVSESVMSILLLQV